MECIEWEWKEAFLQREDIVGSEYFRIVLTAS